jgi:hypothetical protein
MQEPCLLLHLDVLAACGTGFIVWAVHGLCNCNAGLHQISINSVTPNKKWFSKEIIIWGFEEHRNYIPKFYLIIIFPIQIIYRRC